MDSPLIFPDWPVPSNVRACSTTRCGGVSPPSYHSLNVAGHVGDAQACVSENHQLLMKYAQLPAMPAWLKQVHGTRVLRLTGEQSINVDTDNVDTEADAIYSNLPGQVCAVMTADCLPVLFCSRYGDEVAAAHAGWRGLAAGVLERTLTEFSASPADIFAWLGPAIGPQKFEVDEDVKQAFTATDAVYSSAFRPSGRQYLADIYLLARLRLQIAGIDKLYGGTCCTLSDSRRFFSYRRDGITGRMASLIWLV